MKTMIKNITVTLALIMIVVTLGACKSSFPFALNPGKEDFNSGTIGSVRATDAPEPDLMPPPLNETPAGDTTHRLMIQGK